MSTPTVIQACAALYGVVPGASFVSTINTELSSVFKGDEKALLNHYFELVFVVNNGNTSAQVAARIVANLGLTGDEAASETTRMAAVLEATPVKERGGKVKDLIDAFELLTTPAATAFKTAKAAVVTAVADPTYQGIPGKNVVFSSLSVAQIQLGTDEAINAVLLTTGVDTVPGSAGTELITGGVTTLSATDTLQVTDQIDGGAGPDTLTLAVSKSFAGFSGGGFLKNVETVNLSNSSVTAYSFAAKGATGVSTYNVTGEVDLTSLDSIATKVNFSTVPNAATLSLAFVDEAVTGSSDSVSVGISALGTAASTGVLSSATAPTLTTTGVEVLNLSATGNNFLGLSSNGVSTLNVSGAGNVGLKAVGTGLKGIDASALTGNFEANLANASAGISSIKTGAGNDTLRVINGNLSGTATVDLGAGTNKVVYEGTTTAAVVNQFTAVGVGQVDIGGSLAHSITFSGKNAPAVLTASITRDAPSSTVVVTEGTPTSTNTAPTSGVFSSFTDLGARDFVVDIQANRSSDTTVRTHSVSADTTGAVTVNYKASSAAVSTGSEEKATDNVFLSKASSVTVNVPAFTVVDVTNANYTAAATSYSTIFANKASAVTVTGAGDFNGRIATGEAKTLTFTQTGGSYNWAPVIRSADAAGAQKTSTVQTLNITATKNIALTTTQDLAALQSLTITNGGTVSGIDEEDLNAIATLTTTGSGTSSAIDLGPLGATGLAYGVTVTSTGQKAGFQLGQIDVGSSQNVVVNVSGNDGVTGIGGDGADAAAATDAGIVVADSGTSRTGSIVINATGHGDGLSADGLSPGTDTLTIGTLKAKSVSIDVSGASNAVAIGAITATSVTVSGASANDTVTIGDGGATTAADITATSSLTYSGPLTKATTVDVTASGTSFTGALNGGILVDTFNFTSTSATQASIKLTGDLGSGDDVVTISSLSSGVTQTIDISGLADYNDATIRGALNAKNVLIGGTGDDTIFGGTKADVYTGGGGNDVFFLNNKTDTGTVTVSSLLTDSKFASGKSVSTVELDIINGFGSSDRLVIDSFTVAAITTAQRVTYGTDTVALLGGASSAMASAGRLLNGTYNSSANTFTTSSTGADTLYLYDSATDPLSVVLVGFSTGFSAGAGTETGLVGTST